MTPLFKYMRKQHARLLLTQGKVRIGTLYEFRDLESHGDVVGDAGEGKKSLHLHGKGDTWTAKTIPDFAKTFFNLGPEASMTLEGVTLQLPQESPDHYMFCATSEFNEAALSDFGYDSCIRIDDPRRFFMAISHTIRHQASFVGAFHCQYTSRDAPYDEDNGIHPALIKDPKYASQREVRGLWTPHKIPIKPVVIQNRRIAGYCSAQFEL